LLQAQRNRDPLTSQESDKIADLRDRPNDRVKLYQKFLQERIDAIKSIGPDPASEDRKADLRAKYQEFTRISDELQDNLDTAQSTSDEAKQLYKSQEQYFKEHKGERGKNGTGPS